MKGILNHLFAKMLERSSSAETAAILKEHPDIKERIARLERGETKLIPWEEALKRLEQEEVIHDSQNFPSSSQPTN